MIFSLLKKHRQLIVIILATTAVYLTVFGNQFVIDDQYFIKDWPLTRSWSNAGQLLSGVNPESQPGVYRPIRSLLYLAYYQLWGTNPIGYHLHSLLVHLASTILIYFIIKALIKNSSLLPFTAGLLFGLHPIHTESITYIAAGMEMTGVVFFLAAFLAYLRHKNIWTVPLALLAFFTYEITLTLPFLLVLYELTLGKRNWKKIWPIAAAAVGYLFVRIGLLQISPARGDYLAYSFYHTQLTMTKMWVKYLWLLIWPAALSHNQTIVPGFEAFMTPYSDRQAILSQTLTDLPILLSLATVGSLIFAAVRLRGKYPWLAFAVGWFFISLLPVAYFLPQGTAFAEKYLYLASFAFVFILARVLSKIKNLKLAFLAVLIIAVFYGARTYTRNQNWQSPQTLWEYEARIHPQSELAYYNLGIIYGAKGEKDKAAAAYQKALQLKPQFWQAEHNLRNLWEN